MRRTARMVDVCTRRITRRAFVRRAGLLALSLPGSFGLLTGPSRTAGAAPLSQVPPGTAAPSETPTPTPPPATTSTPSVRPSTTPAPTPPTPRTPAGVTRENVLTTLRLSHPRLLLLADDAERIHQALSTETAARTYHNALLRNGSRLLTQPPPERVLIGPRLLTVSRTVLDRVLTLALLYRLGGDSRWAARAREELLTAATFSDWNPSHFLDVAEMSHAFGIGYDWLYDALSPEDRTTIRRALVEKGLRQAEQAYAARDSWTRASHNWNLVCNGGIIIGALAVADEEPGLAGTLLAQALASLPLAIATYAPDGAWPEGPTYWEYGTLYLVSALAALTSALGTDFGLSESPGLATTARFRLHVTGPTGQFFNFADATARAGDAPTLFWLGRRYSDPAASAAAREAALLGSSARDLLWYDASGTPADLASVPFDAHYQAGQVACFRSEWDDRDALYVGFKGGNNAANHAHLDLGTFVLDALGQRWAIELGPDDYDLPGYFGAERWTYERLKTSGQNTLLLNGANQHPEAVAPLTAFESSGDGGFAIADLTAAYAERGATRVHRGVHLRDNRTRVVIQDEVETSQPAELTWAMHTRAAIEVEGERALLKQGGAVLEARLLSPPGATFSVEDVTIAPPQQPASDVRRLLVRLPEVTSVQLAVLFTPRRALSRLSPDASGTPETIAAVGTSLTTETALTPAATGTPAVFGPALPPISAESLPLPEVVELSRWTSVDPAPDDRS